LVRLCGLTVNIPSWRWKKLAEFVETGSDSFGADIGGAGMKKSSGGKVPKTVEEYLAAVPEPGRTTLKKVRAVIQSVLPEEATEVISYRIPCVKYKGMLVGYAAFEDHCSLFGMSGTLLGPLKEDLKKYSISKGTIRFALDKPLPATLIKRLVKSAIAAKERGK